MREYSHQDAKPPITARINTVTRESAPMQYVAYGVPGVQKAGSPVTRLPQRQPSPPWDSEPSVPSPLAAPRQPTWSRTPSTLGPLISHQSLLTIVFMKSNESFVVFDTFPIILGKICWLC